MNGLFHGPAEDQHAMILQNESIVIILNFGFDSILEKACA